MARHIVARTTDIPPGGNKVFGVDGRDIVVFHVNGEFFALLNRCPHAGAPLEKAACVARLTSPEPGVYPAFAGRRVVALRLARLGIRHAQRPILVRSEALQDPLLSGRDRERRGSRKELEDGLAKGPYVAETFPVHVEDSYVIIET